MPPGFSLAPGGWAGSTPGRSGDTWATEQESGSKSFHLSLPPSPSKPQLSKILGRHISHVLNFLGEAYQRVGRRRIDRQTELGFRSIFEEHRLSQNEETDYLANQLLEANLYDSSPLTPSEMKSKSTHHRIFLQIC